MRRLAAARCHGDIGEQGAQLGGHSPRIPRHRGGEAPQCPAYTIGGIPQQQPQPEPHGTRRVVSQLPKSETEHEDD
jgi:hypothetical protein